MVRVEERSNRSERANSSINLEARARSLIEKADVGLRYQSDVDYVIDCLKEPLPYGKVRLPLTAMNLPTMTPDIFGVYVQQIYVDRTADLLREILSPIQDQRYVGDFIGSWLQPATLNYEGNMAPSVAVYYSIVFNMDPIDIRFRFEVYAMDRQMGEGRNTFESMLSSHVQSRFS